MCVCFIFNIILVLLYYRRGDTPVEDAGRPDSRRPEAVAAPTGARGDFDPRYGGHRLPGAGFTGKIYTLIR